MLSPKKLLFAEQARIHRNYQIAISLQDFISMVKKTDITHDPRLSNSQYLLNRLCFMYGLPRGIGKTSAFNILKEIKVEGVVFATNTTEAFNAFGMNGSRHDHVKVVVFDDLSFRLRMEFLKTIAENYPASQFKKLVFIGTFDD